MGFGIRPDLSAGAVTYIQRMKHFTVLALSQYQQATSAVLPVPPIYGLYACIAIDTPEANNWLVVTKINMSSNWVSMYHWKTFFFMKVARNPHGFISVTGSSFNQICSSYITLPVWFKDRDPILNRSGDAYPKFRASLLCKTHRIIFFNKNLFTVN